MSKYMIHTCPQRLWYVTKFLIPAMLEQGIEQNNITLINDAQGKGTLQMTIESFARFQSDDDKNGTWHLQDDIVIADNFAEQTQSHDNIDLVAGFCSDYDESKYITGNVLAKDLWYSFPCFRIANYIAKNFSDWLYSLKMCQNQFSPYINTNKHDDTLFKFFIQDYYGHVQSLNLAPNIVDHIDYLIGGSLINKTRNEQRVRSIYWNNTQIVEQLEEKLKCQ